MSRLERRDSDPRRHRSRFDQEPSPKRSRRDSKPENERHPTNNSSDVRKNSDRERNHQHQLRDAVSHEAPSRQEYRTERTARKVSDQKRDVHIEGTKHSSDPSELPQQPSAKHSTDPAEVPRSRTYFQHDERGNAGQAGRSSRRRESDGHGHWRDAKEQVNRKTSNDALPMDQKAKVHGKGTDDWRHDGYYELETNPKPPAKKRSFREEKISADPEKEETEAAKHNSSSNRPVHVERRNEKSSYVSHHPDQAEKQFTGDRSANRSGTWRGKFPSRPGRYYDSGNFRGRDKVGSRPSYRSNKSVEKWKHDLFNEANKSPPPQNEEDQIAKIEALLAS
ncbi:nucleolar and coiled-body phosphoprotein 1 [Ipomoea triloba]|uniref:nucleolar and coiled-body phosphoprotein 1 n=1 Tax=Ipomoea triloba TaxID=35885 RepID=UPI00125E3B32|nr:nucleolar and coiled-body phosphoprotein 1 [Ipomoea triloba]